MDTDELAPRYFGYHDFSESMPVLISLCPRTLHVTQVFNPRGNGSSSPGNGSSSPATVSILSTEFIILFCPRRKLAHRRQGV